MGTHFCFRMTEIRVRRKQKSYNGTMNDSSVPPA